MWWVTDDVIISKEKTTKSNQYYYWVYKWLTINLTSKPIEITGGCTTSMWWYNSETINALKQLKRGKKLRNKNLKLDIFRWSKIIFTSDLTSLIGPRINLCLCRHSTVSINTLPLWWQSFGHISWSIDFTAQPRQHTFLVSRFFSEWWIFKFFCTIFWKIPFFFW